MTRQVLIDFSMFPVDLLGPLVWYIPTTICGILVVLAGFLTLFVSFRTNLFLMNEILIAFNIQQPETKGQGLKDHVEDDAKLADDNADVELTKR